MSFFTFDIESDEDFGFKILEVTETISLEDRFKSRINSMGVVLNQPIKFLRAFLLKMKEQELVEVIVKPEFL